jgi:hypothetical protein
MGASQKRGLASAARIVKVVRKYEQVLVELLVSLQRDERKCKGEAQRIKCMMKAVEPRCAEDHSQVGASR